MIHSSVVAFFAPEDLSLSKSSTGFGHCAVVSIGSKVQIQFRDQETIWALETLLTEAKAFLNLKVKDSAQSPLPLVGSYVETSESARSESEESSSKELEVVGNIEDKKL